MSDFKQQWREDWARLGLVGDDAWLDRLLASYAEAGRYYHTLQHLSECLNLLDRTAHLADRPGEVAIALWFHDAVYIPQAKDNEARSAAWACEALRAAGASQAALERIGGLIMATAHHEVAQDRDTCLLIDIDLAILGATPARFAEYEQQVRSEYAAVPDSVYQHKRRALLAHFLARPAIYGTPELHTRLEEQARKNLRRAIG